MKITKRQLKRIIEEEYSRLKRKGLIKETGHNAQVIEAAYEEGFEQGLHDATEGMESEIHPFMFNSTEEFEAFKAGYEDAFYS